ncbi:hypothetical protein YC2023_014961 [Brassica napus]
MGTHKFRFSAIMPHSWLYKLKGISRSSRKRLPSSPKHLSSTDASSSRKLRETLLLSSSVHHPQGSSPPPKPPFKRKIKRKTVHKPSSRLKLSSSSLNSPVTLTTYRNHRSVLTSANAIILDPPLKSHVSLTSSWNHRSKSTVGSSSKPVSSSPSDQIYGFSREPESKSIDIKALNRVDSEDPSISDNSSPVLVETVKQKTCDTRTQLKLKKPKAGSSGIRIRACGVSLNSRHVINQMELQYELNSVHLKREARALDGQRGLVSDETKKACWLVTALPEGLKEQETKGTKA